MKLRLFVLILRLDSMRNFFFRNNLSQAENHMFVLKNKYKINQFQKDTNQLIKEILNLYNLGIMKT